MKKTLIKFILVVLFPFMIFNSCSDKVDTGDLYTFTGKTMTDYFRDDTTFRDFYKIIQISKVSEQQKSTLDKLLSARGNYTCFAPTNEAIRIFLDSIYDHKPYQIDTISRTIANKIALNCIIDHGNEKALLSTGFNVGAIEHATFNDRHIIVNFDTLQGGRLIIVLNSTSQIIRPDIEVSNGVIHTVNRVIAPSTAILPSLISQVNNMHIFSKLLEVTSWADSMIRYRDEAYELLPESYLQPKQGQTWQWAKPNPEHRYYGYTAFIEPDSVYESQWNIPAPQVDNGKIRNWDEIFSIIKQKCADAYPDAKADDPTSPDNAVNQFISYHLLNYRVPFNNLVYHYNELGYCPRTPEQLTLDVWEYYETYGHFRRMFKITQSAKDGRMSINRHCNYSNSFTGNYHETSCDRPGIKINANNGHYTNNALNGYYYPIDQILTYDNDVPNKVLNERLRFDVLAAMPEMMTNDIRSVSYSTNANHNIPRGYISGVRFTDETEVTYINQMSEHSYEGWRDWQGDELLISGQVDFTFKLMPVPYDGTYEVRFGMTNQPDRIMGQIYFGTDPNNLPALGLPLDFRTATSAPAIGWIADTKDIDANLENDKNMRNRGFMKAPNYCAVNSYGSAMNNPMRSATGSDCALRRIIWTGKLEAQKTYYIRIKSVLESTTNGLALDYIELVPKWVYSGPEGEDIW
jgi:hypothetical protein